MCQGVARLLPRADLTARPLPGLVLCCRVAGALVDGAVFGKVKQALGGRWVPASLSLSLACGRLGL